MTLRILNFPREILAQVLQYENISHAVVKLWLCGDQILNEWMALRLSEVRLMLIGTPTGNSLLGQKSPPKMLLQLRSLRNLSLHSAEKLFEERSSWLSFLSMLPDTLESLELVSGPDHFRFLSPDPYSALSMLLEESSSWYSSLPVLTSLTLVSEGYNWNPLPPTLTYLDCRLEFNYAVSVTAVRASYLPRSLTRLAGQTEIFNVRFAALVADWASAPPHLAHIDFLAINDEVQDYSWLPTSLTLLNTSPEAILDYNSKLTRSLPPKLANLKAEVFIATNEDVVDLQELPRSLTCLEINAFGQKCLWDPASLPHTLTRLSLDSFSDIDWTSLSSLMMERKVAGAHNWPPHLKSLRFICCHSFQSSDFMLLPHTLLHLDVETVDGAVQGSHLPPHLTSLRLVGVRLDVNDSPMPQSLTKLLVTATHSPTTVPQCLPIGSLPNLLRLEYSHSSFINDPGHTALQVLKVSTLKFDELGVLPRNLTKLRISELSELYSSAAYANGGMFEALPPRLTSLEIGQKLVQIVLNSQRLAAVLPRLRTLRIRSLGYWPSHFARELPRGLEVLNMTIAEIHEVDAPFLPTGICRLSLHGLKIEACRSYLFQYWPHRCFNALFSPAEKARVASELLK